MSYFKLQRFWVASGRRPVRFSCRKINIFIFLHVFYAHKCKPDGVLCIVTRIRVGQSGVRVTSATRYIFTSTDRPAVPSGCAVYGVCSTGARLLVLRVRIPPGTWMSVCCVCCEVDVSAASWSLVQRSATDCNASLCVIYKPLEREDHDPHWAAAPQDIYMYIWV